MMRQMFTMSVAALFLSSVAMAGGADLLKQATTGLDKAKAAKEAAAKATPAPAAPKPKGACVNTDSSRFGGCVETSESNDVALKGVKAACEQAKGKWSAGGSCATANILGSCQHKTPVGVDTVFIYKVGENAKNVAKYQDQCKKLAGTWTAAK